MTVNLTSDVEIALRASLLDVAGETPVRAVTLPVEVEPVGVYISKVVLYTDRRAVTLGDGGQDEMTGIFQVDVNVPPEVDPADGSAVVDRMLDYYSAGRKLEAGSGIVFVRRSTPSTERRGSTGTVTKSVSVYWFSRSTRRTS